MVRLGFAAEGGDGGGGGWWSSVVLDGRKQEGKGEEIKDICFCKGIDIFLWDILVLGFENVRREWEFWVFEVEFDL